LIAFFWAKPKNKPSRVILFYVFYSIANEFFLGLLETRISNAAFLNVQFLAFSLFTIIEFECFCYVLGKFLRRRIFKNLLVVANVFFIAIAFTNLVINFTRRQFTFDTVDFIPISTSGIILLMFSMSSLFEEIQNPTVDFIYNTYFFWIILGIMIYFAGTFFLFLYYNDITKGDKEIFWNVNLLSIILKNIFFSIAFLMPEEAAKKEEPEGYFPEN